MSELQPRTRLRLPLRAWLCTVASPRCRLRSPLRFSCSLVETRLRLPLRVLVSCVLTIMQLWELVQKKKGT